MRFVEIDGCPVPAPGAEACVRAIKEHRPDLRLNSCYRGSALNAAGILRRFHKSTQAWLYRAYWILHLPGYRPANPPGFSTHECHNDGVAFRWIPRGAPIPGWMVGQDWSNGAAAAQAARSAGFYATLTYPSSPLESQHINLRRKPVLFRSLKPESKGLRVRRLQYQLHVLGFFPHKRGRFYGPNTVKAVKAFQRAHGMNPDGIYGPHTHQQLQASYRWHSRKGKK
jgi:hypothetical protein